MDPSNGFPHFALTFLRSHFCAHIFVLVFWSRILRLNLLIFLGKLYVLPIESAFKYLHQLNRNESSNGFHILRSYFCAPILNSHERGILGKLR